MAPSPEHDNEPKAPDKTDGKRTDPVDVKPSTDHLEDTSTSAKELDFQEASVSGLNDEQLRSLLDEAINYKIPKDREGKSKMFKVLLQEAEEDERNARAASASGPQLARYYNTSATRRHRASGGGGRRDHGTSVAGRLTHGGSLQDLAQPALYGDVVTGPCGGRRRRRGTAASAVVPCPASVSARQREGGSLPSNVNVGATIFDRGPIFDDVMRRRRDKGGSKSSVGTGGGVQNSDQTKRPDRHQTQQQPQTTSNQQTALTQSTPQCKDKKSEPLECIVSRSECVVETKTPEIDEARSLLGRCTHPIYKSTSTTEMLNLSNRQEEADRHTETVSTSLILTTDDEEIIVPHRIPRIRYTSHAKLEVDSSGTTHTTTASIPATYVDKAITFPQLQTPVTSSATLQLDDEWNSVSCIVKGNTSHTTSTETHVTTGTTMSGGTARHASGVTGAGTVGTIVPAHYRLSVAPKLLHSVDRIHHATISTTEKKGLDENGNAVQGSTVSHDSKKKKKCKVDRNVTVLNSEEVEGHRADIIGCIDLLVKYIEDSSGVKSGARNHQTQQNNQNNVNRSVAGKHKNQMEGKRRSRAKGKPEVTVKKSNSLEEISRSKLEDLLVPGDGSGSISRSGRPRVRKQSTSDDGDRRSWTQPTDEVDPDKRRSTPTCDTAAVDLTVAPGEFHVVTKKKKSRKRRSSSGGAHRHQYQRGAVSTDAAGDEEECQDVGHRRYHQQQHGGVVDEGDRNEMDAGSSNRFAQVDQQQPHTKSHQQNHRSTTIVDNTDLDSQPSTRVRTHSRQPSTTTEDIDNKPISTTSTIIDQQPTVIQPLQLVSQQSINQQIQIVNQGQQQVPVITQSQLQFVNQPPIQIVNQQVLQPVQLVSQSQLQIMNQQMHVVSQQIQLGQQNMLHPASEVRFNNSNRQFHARDEYNCDGLSEHKPRRKSACSVPPSDRGSDSSDVDSVHSLPADNARAPAPLGSASYADIARTAGNYPNNNCGKLFPRNHILKTDNFPDEFPTLKRTVESSEVKRWTTNNNNKGVRVKNTTCCESLGTWPRMRNRGTPPDRPAVIILDDEVCDGTILGSMEPIEVSGLTFGFELNEQLLNNSGERCVSPDGGEEEGCAIKSKCVDGDAGEIFCTKFVPPAVNTDAYNYEKIVEYIGLVTVKLHQGFTVTEAKPSLGRCGSSEHKNPILQ